MIYARILRRVDFIGRGEDGKLIYKDGRTDWMIFPTGTLVVADSFVENRWRMPDYPRELSDVHVPGTHYWRRRLEPIEFRLLTPLEVLAHCNDEIPTPVPGTHGWTQP